MIFTGGKTAGEYRKVNFALLGTFCIDMGTKQILVCQRIKPSSNFNVEYPMGYNFFSLDKTLFMTLENHFLSQVSLKTLENLFHLLPMGSLNTNDNRD